MLFKSQPFSVWIIWTHQDCFVSSNDPKFGISWRIWDPNLFNGLHLDAIGLDDSPRCERVSNKKNPGEQKTGWLNKIQWNPTYLTYIKWKNILWPWNPILHEKPLNSLDCFPTLFLDVKTTISAAPFSSNLAGPRNLLMSKWISNIGWPRDPNPRDFQRKTVAPESHTSWPRRKIRTA